MPRRIREFALQSVDGAEIPGGKSDGYLDKVIKYVPADVVAAWTAAVAIIKGAVGIPSIVVLLICFAVGLVVTCWWTLALTKTAGQPPAIKQAIVALFAFAVWVLALGDLNDVLNLIPIWHEAYAKLILIGFTLISGKI